MEAVGQPWTARSTLRELVVRLEQESPWLAALALYATLLLVGLPKLLAPDTWLALVSGREIVESGLPRNDSLTTWAAGTEWIDQPWLGQLVLYGAHAAGGMRLALLAGAAALALTLGLVAAYGRRRGASAGAVAVVMVATMVATAASTAVRTETLVYPLFVAVVWLLLEDARRPSPRVLFVLPMLALWANVHGSVLLVAGLAALHGLLSVRRRPRTAVALLLAPAALLATPYGLDSIEYVRRTAGNRIFPSLLEEWAATSFPSDWRFFAVAFATAWLLARARNVTLFERLAFVGLLVGALTASRYTVWFVLYAAMILPPLIDREWTRRALVRPRTTTVLAASAAIALAIALATVAVLPAERLRAAYPDAAEAVVAHELDHDPDLNVFASEIYADWLLYEIPAAHGRVAFDTRFELLTDEQLRSLIRLNNHVEGWRGVLRGHRLLVVETLRHGHLIAPLASQRGAKTLYADGAVTVILRPRDA
jgi:hypothetical protein